jgi:hypothetical protein
MSIIKEVGARFKDAIDQHVRGHAAETIRMRQIHRKVSSAISEDLQLYAEKIFAEKVELLEFLKTAAFEHFIYETIALAYSGTLTVKRLEATPAYQDLKRLKEIIDGTEVRFVTEMIARYQRLANNHDILIKMHRRVLIGRSVRKGETIKTERGEIQHVGKVLGFMRTYLEELEEMSAALGTLIKALHPVRLKKGCEALSHSGVATEIRTATQRFLGNRRTMYGIQDFNDLQEVKSKVFGQARDSLMRYVHKQEQTLVEAIKSPEHSQTINKAFPEIRRLTTLLESNAGEQRVLIKRTEQVLGDLFDIEISLLSEKQKADLKQRGLMPRFALSGAGRFVMAGVTATIAIGAVSNMAYAQEADRPAVVQQVVDQSVVADVLHGVERVTTYVHERLTEHLDQVRKAATDPSIDQDHHMIKYLFFYKSQDAFYQIRNKIKASPTTMSSAEIDEIERMMQDFITQFGRVEYKGVKVFTERNVNDFGGQVGEWIGDLRRGISRPSAPPPGVRPELAPPDEPDHDHDGATDEEDEPDTIKTPQEIIDAIIAEADRRIPRGDIHLPNAKEMLEEMSRAAEVEGFMLKSVRIRTSLTYYAFLAQESENEDHSEETRRALREKADQIYASAHAAMERAGIALFHEGVRSSDAIDEGMRIHRSFGKYIGQLDRDATAEHAEAEQQEIIIQAQRTFTEAERDGDLSKLNSVVDQLGGQISALQIMGEILRREQGDSYDPGHIEGRRQPFIDALAPMQARLDRINELRGLFPLKDIIRNEATLRFIGPNADIPAIAKEIPQDQAKVLIKSYMKLHEELQSDSTNANRYFTRHFQLFDEVVRHQATEGHKHVEEAITAFGQSQEPDATNPDELSDKALVALEYAGIFLKALEPSKSLMEEHRRLKAEIDQIESQIHSQAIGRLYQEATTEYAANEYGNAVQSYLDYFKSLPKSGEAAAQSDKIQTAKTNILEAINYMNMRELKEALHGTEGGLGFKVLTTAMHETGAEGTTPELKAALRDISDALAAKITELGGNPDVSGDYDPDIIIEEAQKRFAEAERTGNLDLLRQTHDALVEDMHAVDVRSVPDTQRDVIRSFIERIDEKHQKIRARLKAILQIEVTCQMERLLPAEQLEEFNKPYPNYGAIVDLLDTDKAYQFARHYIRLNEKLAEDDSARIYFSKHEKLFSELIRSHYLKTVHYLEEAQRLYTEAGNSTDTTEASDKRAEAGVNIQSAKESAAIVVTGTGILSKVDYNGLSKEYKKTQRMARHGVERADGGFTIRGVQDKEVIIFGDAEWGGLHAHIKFVRQDKNGIVFATMDEDKVYHIFFGQTDEMAREISEAASIVETNKTCCFKMIDGFTVFTFKDTDNKEHVYFNEGVSLGFDNIFLIGAKVLEDQLLFSGDVDGARHILYGDTILPRTDRNGQELGRSSVISSASIEDDAGTRILKVKIGRTTYEFEL